MTKRKYDAFSAIIPSYNEAATVSQVVAAVLETPNLGEVIVVDDGSTDKTYEILQPYEKHKQFTYVKHLQNRGKGAALKTGIKKAKHDVILFLDADLKDITSKKIEKIVKPVLYDKVDLSRARFTRKLGRLTEVAVKPMMRILFPEQQFDQPITGQICGKKEFFNSVNLTTSYGVDIGILLDAIEHGQRIQEVDIGKLEHKHQSEEGLANMAEQVLETLIAKSGLIRHKYKLVIFTLDRTFIPRREIEKIWKKLGIYHKITGLIRKLEDGTITYPEYLLTTAALYKGKPLELIHEACADVALEPYGLEVIKALKARRFLIGIISPTLSPVAAALAEKLKIEHFECIELECDESQVLTGRINPASKKHWLGKSIENAMIEAARRLARRCRVRLYETVMVAHTPLALSVFDKVGLSLAYQSRDKKLRIAADKTISVLAEVLALVE